VGGGLGGRGRQRRARGRPTTRRLGPLPSPSRDVAVLDAYFFLFVAAGVGLLYYTMPRALVVRPPKAARAAAAAAAR